MDVLIDVMEDMDFMEAEEMIREEEERRRIQIPRVYRDRTNAYDRFSDQQFLLRFRLSKRGK